MALKVGDQAPDFTLPDSEGKKFTLSENMSGEPCILYFYPRDFTPGCTKEACDFRDQYDVFQNQEINIFGISTDTISSHHDFREKHNLQFELLSDEKGEVSKKYDAIIPFINVTKRITYLLDENHKIKAIYNSFFGAKKHVKKMIEEVKK